MQSIHLLRQCDYFYKALARIQNVKHIPGPLHGDGHSICHTQITYNYNIEDIFYNIKHFIYNMENPNNIIL